MIIPRDPDPIPLEDRNVDELTFDEARELARELLRRRQVGRYYAQADLNDAEQS